MTDTFVIRNLFFSYPEQSKDILHDMNLTVRRGEFLVLCGPSGCGKSTLLRQLKTVLAPHGCRSGTILFEGQPLDSMDQRQQTERIGFVQQSPDNQIVTDKVWHELAFGLEKRTNLYAEGDTDGIKALEKELLAQNANHKDWCCTEELMKTTKDGKALYMHCLPADINDVSCKDGEVEASVFDRYRDPLYKEASYKPYIIAAMIFLAKVKDPQATLKALEERGIARWFQK